MNSDNSGRELGLSRDSSSFLERNEVIYLLLTSLPVRRGSVSTGHRSCSMQFFSFLICLFLVFFKLFRSELCAQNPFHSEP